MKSYLRVLLNGVLVIAILIVFSVITAKRANGLAAAAVQVVNSVIGVDTESPARKVFNQLIYIDGQAFQSKDIVAPDATKKIVIENVSGFCTVQPGTGLISIEIDSVTPDPTGGFDVVDNHVTPVYTNTIDGNLIYGFSQATRIYGLAPIPGGSLADATVTVTTGRAGLLGNCRIAVTGYFSNL